MWKKHISVSFPGTPDNNKTILSLQSRTRPSDASWRLTTSLRTLKFLNSTVDGCEIQITSRKQWFLPLFIGFQPSFWCRISQPTSMLGMAISKDWSRHVTAYFPAKGAEDILDIWKIYIYIYDIYNMYVYSRRM